MMVEYIKPFPIKYILTTISKCLKDKVFPLRDVDILQDRNKFIASQFDYDQHRSNKKEDMDYLFWESIRTICIEISQVVLFHRIIRTTDKDLPILPRGKVPPHLNPLKRKDYDKSTLSKQLEKVRIDEMYNEIEGVMDKGDLLEKKDMPLEMVRALNILNNEIDKSVYKKKMEFGKKYSKVRDKIISASKFLTKLVSKMR